MCEYEGVDKLELHNNSRFLRCFNGGRGLLSFGGINLGSFLGLSRLRSGLGLERSVHQSVTTTRHNACLYLNLFFLLLLGTLGSLHIFEWS